VARIISGVGVGIGTVIIPMYSAEMAPKHIRGTLGSFFQFFFTMGVMVSYWIDYAVQKHMPSVTGQWQVPVGLQLVPGVILGAGMLLTRESVRWLAKKGRRDEALESLAWVRGCDIDTEDVRIEYVSISHDMESLVCSLLNRFAEIMANIEEEAKEKADLSWRELVAPSNRKRVALIVGLQIGMSFPRAQC
jgi:MFS family permease